MSAARGVLLGLDHGERVIGVACCDASWLIARPLAVIQRSTRAADFAKIAALAAQQRAVGVVVGLPILPEGETAQSRTVRRWASRLAAAVPLPVYLWDESYSSAEAQEILSDLGAPQPERVDAHAAAVILWRFIAAHPPERALPVPLRAQSG
ncbi:MAG: Holliday junction resolvase RuvX [Candidatus Thermofonsia Clade 1 bacterium]|jgi:putative Holliday junction resolvase|uniref:Putative pre-16S rRNA nuclease n=1 Tax=Candidatus Thermofonsia Clade 1 bacterium TaxID=2364210 RepID=A0A2M8PA64_9CHLR|nr:MAG: Holliday junction resolvase RuvX [Candidatus Thermofonsia Clade 1 bacterium]